MLEVAFEIVECFGWDGIVLVVAFGVEDFD